MSLSAARRLDERRESRQLERRFLARVNFSRLEWAKVGAENELASWGISERRAGKIIRNANSVSSARPGCRSVWLHCWRWPAPSEGPQITPGAPPATTATNRARRRPNHARLAGSLAGDETEPNQTSTTARELLVLVVVCREDHLNGWKALSGSRQASGSDPPD